MGEEYVTLADAMRAAQKEANREGEARDIEHRDGVYTVVHPHESKDVYVVQTVVPNLGNKYEV